MNAARRQGGDRQRWQFGIGAATARRFADEGAKVVVTGRRREPLLAVADETGGLAFPGDSTDPGHADAAVRAASEAFGGLDIVVANAGVGFGGTAASVTDVQWVRTLDVNVTGAMRLAQAAIPAIADRGGGSIVLVSSVSGGRVVTLERRIRRIEGRR